MAEPAIRVEGLWKQYRLGGGSRSGETLYDVLSATLRAPFRRRGMSEDSDASRFWALRDVAFEVTPGEVVGIIGRNGAGKSTLLKVLTRITEPTRGRIEIRGRVASLLEVGTGFHPELSGRENVYLNGAILGMSRQEISRKFDEIVAFAEVGKFLDTPVKRYSSGMYVRLAFAVAAHLEPDVLVVDEVLAVGDASFQKKCLAKMSEVRGEGRTVLFVSHNMTAVHQLCTRALLLEQGRAAADGGVGSVVGTYLSAAQSTAQLEWSDAATAPGNDRVRLHALRIRSEGSSGAEVAIDRPVEIEVDFWILQDGLRDLCVNLYLLDSLGSTVLSTANTEAANLLETGWFRQSHKAGLYRTVCTIPANFLNNLRYLVSAYVVTLTPLRVEAAAEQAASFVVHDTGALREAGMGGEWHGVVRVPLAWQEQVIGPPPVASTTATRAHARPQHVNAR